MSEYKFIRFTNENGRADMVLNSPPLNLLSVDMLEEIVKALNEIRDDDSLKALKISAAGSIFCGGSKLEDLTSDTIGTMMPLYSRLYNYLNDVRGLTVAVIQGEAIGFGAELAAFCDVAIAADSAFFSFPQISMGLFPPIATAILPRLIGRNRTLDWIVSGRKISATEAVQSKMIARIVPELVLYDYSERYVSRVAGFSAPAVVLAKRAVDSALYTPAMEALRATESTYMLDLMNSLDPHEGIKAAIEGRKPVWKNR